MLENQDFRPAQVIGPLGEPLTLDSLPPADTTRWVVRRKAEVVAAVAGGLLSVDDACKRYTLSLEEFTSWQRAVDRSGMPGLRVTRIKQYRDQYDSQQRYSGLTEAAHSTRYERTSNERSCRLLTKFLDEPFRIRNNRSASRVCGAGTAGPHLEAGENRREG